MLIFKYNLKCFNSQVIDGYTIIYINNSIVFDDILNKRYDLKNKLLGIVNSKSLSNLDEMKYDLLKHIKINKYLV